MTTSSASLDTGDTSARTESSNPGDRPIRLLVIVNVYRPDLGGGVLFADLCEGLAARGFDVTVKCAYSYYPEWIDKSGKNGRRIEFGEENGVLIERHGLFIPRNPNSLVQRLIYEASFWASLRRRRPRPGDYDALMVFCPLVGAVAYAAGAARRAQTPLWLNVQDLSAQAARVGGLAGSLGSILERVQNYVFRKADFWTTISESMADQLQQIPGAPERTDVLPNWLHSSLAEAIFLAGPKPAPSERRLPPDHPHWPFPDAFVPDASASDASASDASASDASASDASASDAAGSEASTPDATGSEASTPDAAGSEASTPDAAGSEASTPDAAGSEAEPGGRSEDPRPPVRLLYSGNIGSKQELLRFCKLLSRTKSTFKLSICAAGARAGELREWIRQSEDDRFSMSPLMDETGLAEALRDADAYVITEREHAGASFIPSKLIPGISSGTPLLSICDSRGPLGQEVRARNLGPSFEWEELSTPGGVKQLEDVIQSLASDRGRVLQWRQNVRLRATFYARAAALDRYEQHLRRIVDHES